MTDSLDAFYGIENKRKVDRQVKPRPILKRKPALKLNDSQNRRMIKR